MVSFSCRHHFDWRYWTSSLEMVLILSCFHPSVNSLYILIWWRGNPRICSMMGQQRSGGAPHNGHFWAKDLNYPFSWERPLSHSWRGKFNLSPPQDVIITRKHIGMSLAMVLPKATSKVLVSCLYARLKCVFGRLKLIYSLYWMSSGLSLNPISEVSENFGIRKLFEY